jgi:hypothetical protein
LEKGATPQPILSVRPVGPHSHTWHCHITTTPTKNHMTQHWKCMHEKTLSKEQYFYYAHTFFKACAVIYIHTFFWCLDGLSARLLVHSNKHWKTLWPRHTGLHTNLLTPAQRVGRRVFSKVSIVLVSVGQTEKAAKPCPGPLLGNLLKGKQCIHFHWNKTLHDRHGHHNQH